MFNALKYTESLEKAGFTRKQAEKSISILIEIMEQNLATKNDISKLEHRLRELELRMTVKLGSMLVVSIGIMTAIQKIF